MKKILPYLSLPPILALHNLWMTSHKLKQIFDMSCKFDFMYLYVNLYPNGYGHEMPYPLFVWRHLWTAFTCTRKVLRRCLMIVLSEWSLQCARYESTTPPCDGCVAAVTNAGSDKNPAAWAHVTWKKALHMPASHWMHTPVRANRAPPDNWYMS